MKKYISNQSALQYWNFPLAQQFFAAQIALATETQYIVLNKRDRFTSGGTTPRLCAAKIPKNGLIISENVGVVSPELMFIQLASTLDIHEMIILGDLLCSCPDGPRSNPLMRKSKLLAYVQQAEGHHGRKKALTALKYVKERACSIMEVFVDLFIGLPNSLGGLGLKGGIFNFKVELDPEGAAALGQKTCFIDYCFPETKIAYEYLGDSHNNSIDYDSVRNMALHRMGFQVITITKTQLYNHLKLNQLLRQAAKISDARVRIRTENFAVRQRRIRDLLPRSVDNTNICSSIQQEVIKGQGNNLPHPSRNSR